MYLRGTGHSKPVPLFLNTISKVKYNPYMRTLLLLCAAVLALNGCSSPAETPVPTPFTPPTVAVTPTPMASPVPTIIAPSATPDCTDNLTFLSDLTIPDGTQIPAGESIDKRWQVLNSGSCNWDARYTLVLITGAEMGSQSPQALYPALSGAEATVRILFTAPNEPGIYRSAWQAVGPDGQIFGDPIFIEISVP